MTNLKTAIVQAAPSFLDKEKGLKRIMEIIKEASGEGAGLVVFGETWLAGYPAWLDYCPEISFWDHPPVKDVFSRTWENGVVVGGKETRMVGEAAADHGCAVCLGINEIVEKGKGNGTIYNSHLLFNEQGEIAVHHRKLMPTFTEKLVYGIGDGRGLEAMDTKWGRIGALICWEHWMPLARQAMHDSGEHLHIALWPRAHELHHVASRHYAFEGRCYVIAVGQHLRVRDLPQELKVPEELASTPDRYLLDGGSCVFGPDGKFLMEPVYGNEDIIYYEFEDLKKVYKERMTLDTSGHYQRDDIFQFNILRS